tara:strand:+ start:52 stop:705 length:654 start_codon:yes stop_codon:yes gene_type:complete
MKIIFYSAQTSNRGFIPSIKEQSIYEFDYWFAHDNHFEATENKGWNYINIKHRYPSLGYYKKHRLVKMVPRLLFDNFDYTVWVDCKFYQHKDFYKHCLNIINNEQPEWMACYHKQKRTLKQELDFAANNRYVPQKELEILENKLRFKFFSTDTCWLIRKNTDKNHDIGHQWFKDTDKYFSYTTRDQLTFPLCVDEKYLNLNHSIEELEKHSFIRHVM